MKQLVVFKALVLSCVLIIKGDNSDQHFNFLPFSTFSGHTLACSDACSGRTHVPTSSSKIREVAQGSSYALP